MASIDGRIVEVLLRQRGKWPVSAGAWRLVDDSDGHGPRVVAWDVAQCGSEPTAAEVDAAAAARGAVLVDAEAETDASNLRVRATIEWTLRRLLGRPPTPAERLTARNEWLAIWKALS